MKTTLVVTCLAIVSLALAPVAPAADTAAATQLVLKSQTLVAAGGPLEPEVLDFRYQPPRFQTCVGLPDDSFKTIVGSDGGLYYDFGKAGPANYTLGAGRFGTRILADLDTAGTATPKLQQLCGPRVPVVTTHHTQGPLQLRQVAWAGPPVDGAGGLGSPRADFLWLTVTNTSQTSAPARLRLDAGSIAPLSLDDARTRIVRAGGDTLCRFSRACLRLPPEPARPAARRPLVLAWDLGPLEPGHKAELLVTVPQGPPAKTADTVPDASAEMQRAITYWQQAPLPYGRIEVADPTVQGLLDSCVRNIYQAREIKQGLPAFQVGPTCYRGLWVVDGSFILEAATLLGRADEARRGIDYLMSFQKPDGGFMLINGHWKETGIVLWAVTRHARLTGDKAWLAAMWPRLEHGLEFIRELRRRASAEPGSPSAGLMPSGFSDGGLAGPAHEYTNVYWTLIGLRAAAQAATWLGQSERASVWQAEYDDFLATFRRAAARDMRDDGQGHRCLPIVMQAPADALPQKAQWAFLHAIYPGGVFEAADPLVQGNMAMLAAREREGLVFDTGWLNAGLWNYFGSFYGHAWLWLGQGEKAAVTLYAFGNHASPLLCWREEHRPQGDKPGYVGDMPHNWASAEFLRLACHLLILERGNELHLLEGMPRAWARPGAVNRLREIPTIFGPVSLTLRVSADGRTATLNLTPPRREPPARIVLHLEHFDGLLQAAHVDGQLLHGDTLTLPTKADTEVQLTLKPRP